MRQTCFGAENSFKPMVFFFCAQIHYLSKQLNRVSDPTLKKINWPKDIQGDREQQALFFLDWNTFLYLPTQLYLYTYTNIMASAPRFPFPVAKTYWPYAVGGMWFFLYLQCLTLFQKISNFRFHPISSSPARHHYLFTFFCSSFFHFFVSKKLEINNYQKDH